MKSAYVVLARKHRPMAFGEVVGQEGVTVTLKNALSSKRLAHAYLFTGPRGVGKTTMARLLAKALNCASGPGPEPCLKCHSCSEIAASSSLDVLEMDAASHTSVDNVRETIIETVALAPARDRYKIFIIDEAHMLSTSAFNALLKTLEEPPAHVVFILATTETSKIPATISSRCQRFRFKPIPPETIAAHLKELARREKIEVEPEALDILALSATGSLRDAVSLLDQAHTFSERKLSAESVRDMLGFLPSELVLGAGSALLGKDAAALSRWLKGFYEQGYEPAQLLRDLREAFEEVYLAKLGVAPMPKAWKEPSLNWEAAGMGFLVRRINRALEDMRGSDSPRLAMELALFGCLEAAGDLSLWVARLEELERRLGPGESQHPAPTPLPRAPGTAALPGKAPSPALSALPTADVSAGTSSTAEVKRYLLGALAGKPSLCSAIERGELRASAQGAWVLVFGREFDLRTAERAKPALEAILATKSGRQIKLSLEIGVIASPEVEEIIDKGMPEPPPARASGLAWKDVTEPGEGAETPLGKAAKILGGKAKFVRKIEE